MRDHATFPAKEINTDFEVRSLDETVISRQARRPTASSYLKYLITGTLFGIILVKSEVISWFRIQEMFRVQSFHMYGVIGSAVITGILSVWLIRKFNIKTVNGNNINLPQKKFHIGQVYGGLLFGSGWALTGACPGPLFAQLGSGATVTLITIIAAIGGTWLYGLLRGRLPH